MLLTNDGALAQAMSKRSQRVPMTYHLKLQGLGRRQRRSTRLLSGWRWEGPAGASRPRSSRWRSPSKNTWIEMVVAETPTARAEGGGRSDPPLAAEDLARAPGRPVVRGADDGRLARPDQGRGRRSARARRPRRRLRRWRRLPRRRVTACWRLTACTGSGATCASPATPRWAGAPPSTAGGCSACSASTRASWRGPTSPSIASRSSWRRCRRCATSCARWAATSWCSTRGPRRRSAR